MLLRNYVVRNGEPLTESLSHFFYIYEYRKTVYQNAKDGWYAPAGGNWYYGVQGGYSFDLVDIILRVGQSRTICFKSLTVPLYATLGVNIRFGDAKQ